MASVKRRGGHVVATLQAEEAQLLRLLAADLRALLAADEPDSAEPLGSLTDPLQSLTDPLQSLTGVAEEAPKPPTDPALARLLPDGYAEDFPDDGAAAAELRRLTEGDIRAAKNTAADAMLASLPESGGRIRLSEEEATAWAAALNDLRLVLGTRLDVTEETEPFGGRSPDDPAAAPYAIYHWLTGLQDDVINALSY